MKTSIFLTMFTLLFVVMSHVHGFDTWSKFALIALCVLHIANIARMLLTSRKQEG